MLTIAGITTPGDIVTVFDARLTCPRSGAWTLDGRLDGTVSGPVSVDIDEGRQTLVGMLSRGGDWQDTGHVRIVGGAGGLQLTATPRHYNGTTVRTVVTDLLRTAGERLSLTSDAATLGRALTAWTTTGVAIGRMLTRVLLTAAPDATWRVLPDGSIWIGVETWPDSGLIEDQDYQVLSEDPMRAEAKLGVETPMVMPGTLLGGRRVSYVENHLNSPETRTVVWFEDEGGGAGDDRLRRAVRGMVRGAQQPIDYFALYEARVVSQKGGAIDVKPDDPRLPSMGGVTLFAGVPEWELSLKPGGRVLIGWSGGDPRAPFAVAFDSSVKMNTLAFGVAALREATVMGETYRAAEDAMLSAVSTAFETAAEACASATNPASTQAGVVATGVGLAAAVAAIQAFQATASTYLSKSVRHS